MKPILKLALAAGLLAGCAQDALRDAETRARNSDPDLNAKMLEQFGDVKALGGYASRLSLSYAEAADNIQRFQDLSSLLVVIAAGRAVDLLAAGATEEVVGRVALGGAAAQTLGTRFAPKDAILGVLTGAKRLNCIALHANVLHATQNGVAIPGAAEATRATIFQAQLLTRAALVREQTDFDSLFGELKATAGIESFQVTGRSTALDAYIQKLSTCVDPAQKT